MAVAEGLPAAGLVLAELSPAPTGAPGEEPHGAPAGDQGPLPLRLRNPWHAFGTPEELEEATALIPGKVTHVWIEGCSHGLRRRDSDAAAAVAASLRTRSRPPNAEHSSAGYPASSDRDRRHRGPARKRLGDVILRTPATRSRTLSGDGRPPGVAEA